MKKQGFNPYMPSWEYVPDGEPHVFGDRVCVYGSHDRFNGYAYCLNDYICYSASVNDLTDWQYEGVIFKKTDDPENRDGDMCLFAPDVTQGPDGRYYLYYVLSHAPIVSVAVCDTPAGKYEFYGYVKYPDGTRLGEAATDEPQFDPGVLTEEKRVYLYTGFSMPHDKTRHGAMVTELEEDMLTVKTNPEYIVPSKPYGEGTGYEGHEFFEASSIRKVGDTYYFVYSSVVNHELCYATSKFPNRDFVYRGVIVSNNDSHIDTYKPATMTTAYGGNNHGGIEKINGAWYIFYHRHTNGTNFSRQGLIEPITILADGTIPQVEMTSCGPNNGPLRGEGTYPAYIACNLFGATPEATVGAPGDFMDARFPRITQEGRDGDQEPGYISNLRKGTVMGFKYFDCQNTVLKSLTTRGSNLTNIEIATAWDGKAIATVNLAGSTEWRTHDVNVLLPDGVQAIYIRYNGLGRLSLKEFTLEKVTIDNPATN